MKILRAGARDQFIAYCTASGTIGQCDVSPLILSNKCFGEATLTPVVEKIRNV